MSKLLPVLLIEYSDKYPGLQREVIEEHLKSSLRVLDFVLESLEHEGLTGATHSREIIVYTAYKIDSIDELGRNHKRT